MRESILHEETQKSFCLILTQYTFVAKNEASLIRIWACIFETSQQADYRGSHKQQRMQCKLDYQQERDKSR